MIIISDASPLIQLADAGCLDVLREIFEEVLIPPEVHSEVFQQRRQRAKPKWIKIKSAEQATTLALGAKIRLAVHPGEAAAIAVAIELDFPIIIDDKAGIGQCNHHGVKCFLLYGVLKKHLTEKRLNEIMKTVRDKTGKVLCEPDLLSS